MAIQATRIVIKPQALQARPGSWTSQITHKDSIAFLLLIFKIWEKNSMTSFAKEHPCYKTKIALVLEVLMPMWVILTELG